MRGLKQDLLVAAEGDGMSHPVWVRGLKLTNIAIYLKIEHVAPRVGAWIETPNIVKRRRSRTSSHPVWVRGLKLRGDGTWVVPTKSHPVWVRGLKRLDRDKFS